VSSTLHPAVTGNYTSSTIGDIDGDSDADRWFGTIVEQIGHGDPDRARKDESCSSGMLAVQEAESQMQSVSRLAHLSFPIFLHINILLYAYAGC